MAERRTTVDDSILDEWADAAGVTFHHGETLRGVSRDDLLQLMRATQAAERERLTKTRGPMHSCDDPLCAVCGNPWA